MARVNDPIIINGIRIKNRLTMAPTVKFDYAGEDGQLTLRHLVHYLEREEGGIGLICVEATAVTPEGRFAKNHLGLWEDAQIEGHKRINETCHMNDVVALIQLNHTGITGNPIFGTPMGPSSIPTRDGKMSKEMSIDEIHAMQESFISAAVRAKEAGYAGIQLHGCHGYLINQFISPKTNLRTDEYGENKALFGKEIIQGIREKCGKDFIISVRTPGAEPDVEHAVDVAKEYVEAGCDYLQISHGIDSFSIKLKDENEPYSDLCALGVNFHKVFGACKKPGTEEPVHIPISCVGGLLTPERVQYIIENDLADTVDLARGILADPQFPNAILNGTPFTKCYECQRCQYGPGTAHNCPAEIKRKK
jgi:2,4-dienoyl-CoA reductase-like NADH-dependent reductase (Old Yellow Enzyme family)